MADRLVCGYQFRHVCTVEPVRDAQGVVQEFSPRTADGSPLSDAPFCRFLFPPELRRSGVYAITVADRPVYVGETNNLSRRFGPGEYGHIVVPVGNAQTTNRRVNHGILEAARRGERVDVWFHETQHRDRIEAALLDRLDLPWNRKGPHGGTATPARTAVTRETRRSSALRDAEAAKAAMLKDPAVGERLFGALLDAYPHDGMVHFKRAEACESLGRLVDAADGYRTAESLLPYRGRRAQARAGFNRVNHRLHGQSG
jgi:hypothetical protein